MRDNAEKALSSALQYHSLQSTAATAEKVVETASLFELYLSGNEPFTADLLDIASAAAPFVRSAELTPEQNRSAEQVTLIKAYRKRFK